MSMNSHVGIVIRIGLEAEGVSQSWLAACAGLSTKHVNQICQGNAPLSIDVALRIEASLPALNAEDLMVAQARYQVRAARKATA